MEILKFLLVIAITVCVVSALVCAFDLIVLHFKSASKQEKECHPNFYNTVLDDWIDRLFRDGITKIEKSEFYDYIQTTNYSVRFWNRNSDFFYASEGAIMNTKGDIVLSIVEQYFSICKIFRENKNVCTGLHDAGSEK